MKYKQMSAVVGLLFSLGWSMDAAAWLWNKDAKRPVVVEVFTSQGCPACPPAEILLGQIGGDEDVIAMGLHVDYFNRNGMYDPFSHRKYSKRQEEYRWKLNLRGLYTPMAVIDGKTAIGAANSLNVKRSIDRAVNEMKDPIPSKVTRDGEQVIIYAGKEGQPWIKKDQDVAVLLFVIDPKQRVQVKSGRMAGRSYNHNQIVQDMLEVGFLRKIGEKFTVDVKKIPKRAQFGLVLQDISTGEVLGSASYRPNKNPEKHNAINTTMLEK